MAILKLSPQPPASYLKPVGYLLIAFTAGYLFAIKTHPAASSQTSATATETVLANTTKKVLHVGIQAGHWKNEELPNELNTLRLYSTGTSAGGYNEWEVNLEVANKAAEILRAHDIVVDVLPATVPEAYTADAFVAIHADGNDDTSVTGYKAVGSGYDSSAQSSQLEIAIDKAYSKATDMSSYSETPDSMRYYYVFNRSKYTHSIAASTPGAILEIGFLTNKTDRNFLTQQTTKVATGVAQGILDYFTAQGLLE